MKIEKRLEELKLTLPPLGAPAGGPLGFAAGSRYELNEEQASPLRHTANHKDRTRAASCTNSAR